MRPISYCVKYGYSDNSVNDFGSALRRLCPDSKIAGNFQMGRKKLMYLVNYGLHPHFNEWVKNDILKSSFITVLFDESLNKTTQQREMGCKWKKGAILRTESEELRRKVKNLIQTLVSLKIIDFKTDGYGALTQYSNFLENEVTQSKELLLSFNRKNCRLDDFSSKI